jgi:hypothetical protein
VQVEQGSSAYRDRYRLDELGWLQFEQLAALVLEAEAGVHGLDWQNRAYQGRTAWVENPVRIPGASVDLPGPVAVAVVWVRDAQRSGLPAGFASQVLGLADDLRLGSTDQMVVVTNLDDGPAGAALIERELAATARLVVLGTSALSQSLDRHPELRSAMPSVLGLRDLAPLIPDEVRARSSFDIEHAQDLARVFVPTRAYGRTRQVLARHRFAVLTGAPEMGKTAIAHMIALAQLTEGWEAYDCTTPEEVWKAFDRERPQVFLADDAFGSTEYRPDAAEHWARELGQMLQALNEHHWLIWTSRPAPLRSGLRRVQRERAL